MSAGHNNQDIEMEEDDQCSNSTEESSPDEDLEDEENEAKFQQLQKEVDMSPYTYEAHVRLIAHARKMADLPRARSAREKMSKIFPLSPELWMDWLMDEKSLASTDEENEKVVELFKRALKDYPSVNIWLEYLQFTISICQSMLDTSDPIRVRETFESALTSVGIHVVQGNLIWEAYREFEMTYHLFLKSEKLCNEDLVRQEDRIHKIFMRQLSVPLLDMDKTYKEFLSLEVEQSKRAPFEFSIGKALKRLGELEKYEDALVRSEFPHYEEYKTYIKYEKDTGDPDRVRSIYERAIIDNCLKEDLWLEYTKYMDTQVKSRDISLSLFERGVRNCPWCVQLWVNYGRSLERYREPTEKVKSTFEAALGMGFTKSEDFRELWLAYLSYYRRKISEMNDNSEDTTSILSEILDVFDRSTTQMNDYFWGTPCEYSIVKYYAFFMAKYKKDVSVARTLWKKVLDHGHKEEVQFWIDYCAFEKIYGDANHFQKACLQAMGLCLDWSESFSELLMEYEHEHGDLASLEHSVHKVESGMKAVNEKRQKRLDAEDRRFSQGDRRFSPKRSKFQRNEHVGRSPVQMDAEGFKIPPLPDRKSDEPETLPERQSSENSYAKRKHTEGTEKHNQEPEQKRMRGEEASDSHGTTIKHDCSKDDRTVFLSNLSYDVDEEKIQEFFSTVGEIEEVRLVRDYKGRSKGFCYVVYKSELDAKAALVKDREKLDNRPVLVSPCEDKRSKISSQSNFKFGTGLEKNKLFIKNLPFSTTEEDLKNLFSEHGAVKDVRLVTYRNGHSKGLAYVEYVDEATASNAVVKMDGRKIQEHSISVAISNPPPRKPKKGFSSGSISDSLGGGGSSAKSGPRGRGRTQLSMVPRAIARPATVKKKSSTNSAPIRNGQPSSSSADDHKPLTNSDFAKMLQK